MPDVIPLPKLLKAIEDGINADGGSRFRGYLRTTLPACEDAYREEEDDFRSHLGASLIGHECSRYLWYVFHWVGKGDPEARMRVLWNRGHLEEGRFIALLMTAGVIVHHHDHNGNQFRVSGVDGYFGGSLDAVLHRVPDYPEAYFLGEFKTHNNKSFESLVKEGVKASKYQHYGQMMIYLAKQQLPAAVYLAVNKDNERLYAELLPADSAVATQLETRAEIVVYADKPPKRISERATWYKCTFCDFKRVCHEDAIPDRNCRTCDHVRLTGRAGAWACSKTGEVLDKATQLDGCEQYTLSPGLQN